VKHSLESFVSLRRFLDMPDQASVCLECHWYEKDKPQGLDSVLNRVGGTLFGASEGLCRHLMLKIEGQDDLSNEWECLRIRIFQTNALTDCNAAVKSVVDLSSLYAQERMEI
jgi:hypothetical protein